MEKNRLEKVRKHVFYKHINNVSKNVGKNSRKNFFEKHRFRKQTTLEKNRLEKVRKHVFINTRISWPKNEGKKTREIFFSKNTRISRDKNDGKKSSGKSAKTNFLWKHEYRDQKIGGKKREKIFFQKHTYIASFIRWKKIVWKKCENTFFINTWILWQTMGENRGKNFFQKHTAYNDGKKSSGKSAKTRFL